MEKERLSWEEISGGVRGGWIIVEGGGEGRVSACLSQSQLSVGAARVADG